MTKQLRTIACRALSIIVLATALIPLDASYAYVSDEFDGYEEGREYNTSELYDIEFRTNKLGLYGMTIESHEIPSNEWLTFIGHDYFPYTTLSDQTEVDNTAPSAVYSAQGIVKVDVVFATGELSQSDAFQDYIPHLTSYIESAANNIDAKVEQVETSTISTDGFNADVIFNTWESKLIQHGLNRFVGNSSKNNWKVSGNKIVTTVFRSWSEPGMAWLINDYDISGNMKIHFRFGLEAHETDFGHGEAGFLFKVSPDAKSMYAIIFDTCTCGNLNTPANKASVYLCKVLNGNYVTEISHADLHHFAGGQYYDVDIELTDTDMLINTNDNSGNQVWEYFYNGISDDLLVSPSIKSGSFGFYVLAQKNAYFSNISITYGSIKSLGEAIQDVSWRDGAVRFVIHATDVIPPEFDIENPDRENDYAYTVAKLNNCNAYLINLGTNLNKDVLNQLVEAIKEANGTEKGTFFNNNPIITAMNNAADYIIEIAKKLSKPVDWVLVNTEILWNTEYNDLEHDPPLNLGEHSTLNTDRTQPQDLYDETLVST